MFTARSLFDEGADTDEAKSQILSQIIVIGSFLCRRYSISPECLLYLKKGCCLSSRDLVVEVYNRLASRVKLTG